MTREQKRDLVQLQREILKTVQAYVKPGGILIYSTCTINQEENEKNADWFLKQFPFEAFSLEECLPKKLRGGTASKGYIQFLPGIHGSDGFFIAKFRKNCKQ